jgi:hypothetical protein
MFLLVSPVRALTKAILFPLGDQEGCVSGKEFLVSRLRPLPSAFITQISELATKAIFLPFGDQVGLLSATEAVLPCICSLGTACLFDLPHHLLTMSVPNLQVVEV